MTKKRIIVLSIVGLILLVVSTLGIAYAIFNYTKVGTTENMVTVGNIKFLYTEVSGVGNGISVTDALPISDTEGKAQTGSRKVFDFKVEANTPGMASVPYEITASKTDVSTLDESVIKVYLTEVSGSVETSTPLTYNGTKVVNYNELAETSVPSGKGKTIYIGEVPENTTNYLKTFKVRMWIDENTDFSTGTYNGKTFTLKINIYANANMNKPSRPIYKEVLLNGTDPVLGESLLPVLISDDGIVTKADITESWYSYENKRWANAIVLKNTGKSYLDGEIIPENNIESYFVWIPKYRYQLWDLGNFGGLTSLNPSIPHKISIQFGVENTNDSNFGECTTPMIAGASGKCKVNDYMTHPAFLSFDSMGIWVGKYETGYDGATTHTDAAVNIADNSKVIIKPDVYSWRGITLGNAFKTSYEYLRNNESHLIKNTEWGAVAYLSYSNYGIGGKIRVNNNLFITGYSATKEPTCVWSERPKDCNISEETELKQETVNMKRYNTSVGYLASTTGNITGIYDMSGGGGETVMGYSTIAKQIGGESELTNLYNDFFSNSKWKPYYDLYTTTIEFYHYSNRILGDGLGELGPFGIFNGRPVSSWNNEDASLFWKERPWLYKGGVASFGNTAGIFSSYGSLGNKGESLTYRIVLAMTM